MKKRANTKNPCKICHEKVNKKNGIQCQGACKKWSHFTCLKYTPGKIMDIKAGIITVTCPCPDCYASESLGTCQDLPSNKNKPIPPLPQQHGPPKLDYASQEVYPVNIGEELKKTNKRQQSDFPQSLLPLTPATLKPIFPQQECQFPDPVTQQLQVNKINRETNLQKISISCSCLEINNDFRVPCAVSSSDSNLPPPNNLVLMTKLEQMCDTVGDLSQQIRRLMCKLVEGSTPT